jgi:hypothetical protein
MPSVLHEAITSSIVKEILHQLNLITGGKDTSANFAREIEHGGSAHIDFADSEYGRHEPDALFRHSRAQYPGVIIEVSYSQKRMDLARLADDYILGSDGNIRVVIGLDINYRGKMATLSIWRPRIVSNGNEDEELVAERTVIDQVYLPTYLFSIYSHLSDIPRRGRRTQSRFRRRPASSP